MVGSAAIKQGRSANRKHTYFFFFWPFKFAILEILNFHPDYSGDKHCRCKEG